MLKLFGVLGCLCLAALEAGCASVPALYDVPTAPDGTPSTRSITSRIACELTDLVRDDLPPDQIYIYRDLLLRYDYRSAMLLSLDVTNSGLLEPAFNFPSGMFAFNFGVKLSQSREDNFSVKLEFSAREAAFIWAHLPPERRGEILRDCSVVNTNLAGDLGLRRRITAAIETSNRKFATDVTPTDGEFSGTINFNVTKSLENVGATWTLSHFKGPGNLATVTELNNDKLSFGFASGPLAGTLFDPHKMPFDMPHPLKGAAAPKKGGADTDKRAGASVLGSGLVSAPTDANRVLERQLLNDVTIQLNGIRNLLR